MTASMVCGRMRAETLGRLIKRAKALVQRSAILIYVAPDGGPALAPCPAGSCADHLREYRPECVVLFMEQYDEPEHIVPQVAASIGQYWDVER